MTRMGILVTMAAVLLCSAGMPATAQPTADENARTLEAVRAELAALRADVNLLKRENARLRGEVETLRDAVGKLRPSAPQGGNAPSAESRHAPGTDTARAVAGGTVPAPDDLKAREKARSEAQAEGFFRGVGKEPAEQAGRDFDVKEGAARRLNEPAPKNPEVSAPVPAAAPAPAPRPESEAAAVPAPDGPSASPGGKSAEAGIPDLGALLKTIPAAYFPPPNHAQTEVQRAAFKRWYEQSLGGRRAAATLIVANVTATTVVGCLTTPPTLHGRKTSIDVGGVLEESERNGLLALKKGDKVCIAGTLAAKWDYEVLEGEGGGVDIGFSLLRATFLSRPPSPGARAAVADPPLNPTLDELLRAIPKAFFPGPEGFTEAQAGAAGTALQAWAKRAGTITVTLRAVSIGPGGNYLYSRLPDPISIHGYRVQVSVQAKFGEVEDRLPAMDRIIEGGAVTVRGAVGTVRMELDRIGKYGWTAKTPVEFKIVLDGCRLPSDHGTPAVPGVK